MIFKALINIIKPSTCVEFGVLDGYSTLMIGSALKLLGKGHLFSYDLFEDYSYTNQKYETVLSTIKKAGLESEVTLKKGDILKVPESFKSNSIDFMHVDISNDGDKISRVFSDWNDKIRNGGLIIFEGGSPMRDNVSWMLDYGKTKIYPELISNDILNNDYTYVVIHRFPSVVICSKNIGFTEEDINENGYAVSEKSGITESELFDLL